MRYLLSSIVLALFISCASYPKKKEWKSLETQQKTIINPYFSDESRDYVYKANIDAVGNSFGGIFIIKKLGDQHHRIVFTTEIGNKIFDFTFLENEFKVKHILKEMNKKLLINILKNDFRVLIKEQLFVERSFVSNGQNISQTEVNSKKHFYFITEQKLNKVVRTGNGKEKVAFLFLEPNDNLATNIQILHKNFNLSINLKSL